MKKTLAIMVLVCCAVAVFATAYNSVNIKVAPYDIQYKNFGSENVSTSTYGFGVDISYQRFLVKGLFVEGGFNGDYMLINLARFMNIMPYTGVGYKCSVGNFFTTLHADFAFDLSYYCLKFTKALGMKFGTGVGWNFTDLISMSLSCDGTVTYFNEGGKTGTHYRIIPMIGMSFTF